MSTSEKILSITDILNVIQSNPSHYYNSSGTRFRVKECDALLQQIVPYIDKVLSENPNQFIYILVAWVYKILSIPYTEIDGIEFYLLKIENDENGRDKLQILSVDTHSQSPHIFYVYTSKSSGSMWRYCEYDDQYGHFNKGYDYISNTFIHIKLQIYIDMNSNKVPKRFAFHDILIISLSKGSSEHIILKRKLLAIFPLDCRRTDISDENKIIRNNIYGTDRIVNDDIFRPLRKLLGPGSSFKNSISQQYYLMINNLKELKNNSINTFIPGSPGVTRYTLRMASIVTPIITDKEFSSKVIEAIGRSETGTINKEDLLLYFEILTKYVKIYNGYLKHYFTVETNSSETHQIYMYNTIKTPIVLDLWKIVFETIEFKKLINKDNGNKYRVIYQNYQVVSSPNNIFNGDYKIIVGFIPDDPHINEYGLYTKFISSGFYVYKMFDYDSQVGSLADDPNRLAGDYVFIGDIMNKFYPLE